MMLKVKRTAGFRLQGQLKSCLVLFFMLQITSSLTFAAEVIADLQHFTLGDKKYVGFIRDVFSPEDGVITLLTTLGVIEVDLDFNLLRSYKFDYGYHKHVSAVRVNGELHILGQRQSLSLVRLIRNDIHLLRYGERAPIKIWECRWCSSPKFAYLLDHENPVISFNNVHGIRATRETLRVVQLGTNREWLLEAPGYRICSIYRAVIGSNNPSKGLQDIVYNLERMPNPKFGHYRCHNSYKTIRLSQVDLDNPKPLNEYKGVSTGTGIGPAPPGYQDRSFLWRKLRHVDERNSTAIIEVQDFMSINPKLRFQEPDKLLWKVQIAGGLRLLRHLVGPNRLDCRTEDGTRFDSYLAVMESGPDCANVPCDNRVYELRPGGKWRVAFELAHTSERFFFLR